jgi:very-short-patch-repair endonuclease
MREAEKRTQKFARALRAQMTDAEVILWSFLRKKAMGWRFRRQHPIGPYITDFACIAAKLAVEVDGATHGCEARIYDERRTRFLNAQGWRVMRISNTDVRENLDGVWRTISAALPPLGPSGHSPRERGEKFPPPLAGACTPSPPRPFGPLPRERGEKFPPPLAGEVAAQPTEGAGDER